MAACEELEREYERAKKDPKFKARLGELLKTYAGRPTPLFFARRLTKKLGGAKIYLKREDLLHTGAHKINNCIGQALLVGEWASIAWSLKRRGQPGGDDVCAAFGFECMSIWAPGPATAGAGFPHAAAAGRRCGVEAVADPEDAINEAMRDWCECSDDALSAGAFWGASVSGDGARFSFCVIGREARTQS
jgi:tryptophan synthase beta chain